MIRTLRLTLLAVLAMSAGSALAGKDVDDGQVTLHPEKNARFTIDEFTLGKVELLGYLGELKDSEHVTDVVLKRGAYLTDEHERIVGSIANHLELKAFVLDGKDRTPIQYTPPAPPATPAAPAAEATEAAPPTG